MKPTFAKIMGNALAKGFNLLNSTQSLFDEFDSEAFGKAVRERKDKLLIRGNEWLNEMNEFLKDVKDTVTAFTVTVPFEAGKDNITYQVKSGVLTIVTEFKDKNSSRKTTNTVTVPTDCDTSRMKHTINKEKGTATIIIPKKGSENGIDAKIQAELEKARAKAKETVKIIRKTFDEALENGKQAVDEAISEAKKNAAAKKPVTPKAEPKKPTPKAVKKAEGEKKAAPKAKKVATPKAEPKAKAKAKTKK